MRDNYIAQLEAQNKHLLEVLAAPHKFKTDPSIIVAIPPELKAAIEDIKYYVGNPSAWEHYDDGVSEKIRAILKAAGMA